MERMTFLDTMTPVVEQLPAIAPDLEPTFPHRHTSDRPPAPWQPAKLAFRPEWICVYITEAEPAGWHIESCTVMDRGGEHTEELGPAVDVDGKTIVFPTAADLIDHLKAAFDEHSVRLDYVIEGMRGFGGIDEGFDDEMRRQGLTWACQPPTEGKDVSVIPPGLYCSGCPYRSFLPDKPEQANGYCAYLEWGDWMSVASIGHLRDGLKRCSVNRDDG